MDQKTRHRITSANGTVGGRRLCPCPCLRSERKRLDLANSNISDEVPREGDEGQDHLTGEGNQLHYVVEHLSCRCSIA